VRFENMFECFVISLKRKPERLEKFRRFNSNNKIDFQHFEGVDGRDINMTEIVGRVVAKNTIYRPGSIGCAMSHLALWKQCASQAKSFVILEDDAVARNDMMDRLIELLVPFGEFDLIVLGWNTDRPLELEIAPGIFYGGGFSVPFPSNEHLSDFAASNNPVGLHRLSMSTGSPGYVVSPKGARLLITGCFPMDHRQVRFASWNATFDSQNIDGMMAALFRWIAAYACVAPLVMTANDTPPRLPSTHKGKPNAFCSLTNPLVDG